MHISFAYPHYREDRLNPFSSEFSNEFYEQQDAEFKLNTWWEFIKEKEGTRGPRNRIEGVSMFAEDLNPAMDFERDYRPWRHGKSIHAVGAVAKVVFNNIQDHNYTGFFQQGSQHGLIRLGGATPFESEDLLVPGLGLKLFRDGVPSANFVCLGETMSQESLNFFEAYQSNHISPPENSAFQAIVIKFGTASKPSSMVGVTDLAQIDSTGIPIPIEEVISPFRLILEPNPLLTEDFSGLVSIDEVYEKMEAIPSGTLLYQVYGMKDPTSAFPGILIGDITTSSEMIYSQNSDQYLHFKHQRMSEDLDYDESWREHVCPGRRLRSHK